MNPKGVLVRSCPFPVNDFMDRLENFLKTQGATIYARINQQTEAGKAGITLLPLQFLLFGNPKSGAAVMAQNPLAALDLPLKVIAWEDAKKMVWLAYNETAFIEERYALPHDPNSLLSVDRLIDKVMAL